MKNQSKGKGISNKIRSLSFALILISVISLKGYAQNYPGQVPQPTPPPTNTNPAPTIAPGTTQPPTTYPPNSNPTQPQVPTTPPAPNLNLPNTTVPTIDTSNHLYNPVKPDTGRFKSQRIGANIFNSIQNLMWFKTQSVLEDSCMVAIVPGKIKGCA